MATQVEGTSPNTIQTGYTVGNNPAALQNIGGHVVQLVSANQDEETAYLDVHLSSAANISSSGNTQYKHNVINKISGTYWPSEKAGFAVDGLQRSLTGPTGNKTIVVDDVYISTPCYFGFVGIGLLPQYLRIKHLSDNETPQSIKFQIRFGSDTTFYDVVSSTGSLSYGNLEDLEKDVNNYYTIEIPTYYSNSGTITPITIASGSTIELRVVATLFNNQIVTDETLNSEGYDPNNDNVSQKYAWCVEDAVLCNSVETPTFKVTYPDSTAGFVYGNQYFTQYDYADDEDPNLTALDTIADGLYYIYITSDIQMPDIIPQNQVYKSFTNPIPSPTAASVGAIWYDISTVPATPYVMTEIVEDTTYDWVKTDLMLIGACTFSSNIITSIVNFNYGTAFGVEYNMTSDFSQVINHNYGSDVNVYCQLVCTAANNSYSVGDMITVDNNITSFYDPDDSSTILSYFQIVNTQMTTTIKAQKLHIIDTSQNKSVLLPSTGWKLRVYIQKD